MLIPGIALQIGGARYEQATRVRLRRGLLPIVDRLEAALPAGVEFDGAPGDEVSLSLDGGEGSTEVFTGTLSSIQHGLRSLRLTAHGPALALARSRPAGAFEQLSAAEILERLTEPSSIRLDVRDADLITALFVCEGRATALESITRILSLCGLQAAFSADGTLQVRPVGPDGLGEAVALRYGRELIDLASTQWEADPNTFTVAGEGGGAPDSDQSLWVAQDFFAGDRTDAGAGVRWRSDPLVRTVDDARLAGASASAAQRRREVPVRLHTWLVPAIAPGSLVELHDLPSQVPISACTVRQVIHEVDGVRGGRSDIHASAGEGGSLGDLLGALGGALAGALGGLV